MCVDKLRCCNYGEAECYSRECCSARLIEEFWTRLNLDWQLFDLLIFIDKSTQVFYFINGHFWSTLKPFLTNALSPSLSLNPLLSLSLPPLCLITNSVLPVEISHKCSDDLMRGYHCNKLIKSKLMFHLGIAHNRIMDNNWKLLKFKWEKQFWQILSFFNSSFSSTVLKTDIKFGCLNTK